MNKTVKQSKKEFKVVVKAIVGLIAWRYGEELVKKTGLLFLSSTIVDVAAFCDARRLDKNCKNYNGML